ncbi:16S rRNA processing protein RimM [Henriciella barbarensis]|uniref:Ribosome maturation factor RimM n=1 Tax=Henriciella barbarensis TaxID=86342 RepID=A0A399QYW0_9PROT|nr:ribosome maturation factor RimM [Henriciella barbarensis]RIJ23943.1 16S rRNA processing protein RimM [Henriciella barbarensis]
MSDRSNPERLVVVGALSGAHGVRGDVRVRSFTGEPEAIFDFDQLLDEKGKPLLSVKSYKSASDHFIVTPKTSRQKEEWDAMKGLKLHVSRADLPTADEDEFYIEDLVGLKTCSPDGTVFGRVKSVQNFGAGDLLEVAPDTAGEPAYFVPFTLKDIPDIDFTARTVTIADAQMWADQSDPRKKSEV